MAYVSQEMKSKIAPTIKALLKKYELKGSLSVRNHSELVLTIKSGSIDFIGNVKDSNGRDYLDVNPYWYHTHFSGVAREFLKEAISALRGVDYYDNSDAMTDYFDVSHYISINIGKWDSPYSFTF